MVRLYKVGGWVRDYFLKIRSNDLDYAVEAKDFQEMKEHVLERGCTIFLEKPEFFTIRALDPTGGSGKDAVDFTLCRTDGNYSDYRRPDTVEVGTIMEDLSRRDYTINAMALDENDKLLDPFGGLIDLRAGIVCCVGNSRDRLTEDPLRILRGLRMCVVLGFRLHEDVEELFQDETVVRLLDKISVERKMAELTKMMKKDSVGTLELLNRFPLIMRYTFTHGLWLMPTNKKK